MKKLTLVAIAMLTGCSGGAEGPTLRPALAPSPSGTIAANAPQTATSKVSIFIPKQAAATSNARHRAFVSAATQGIVVSVYADPMAANQTPLTTVGVNLTSANSSCTAPLQDATRKRHDGGPQQGLTCTFTVPVAIGKVDFTFTTYDAPPSAAGATASGSNALGTAELTTTIVANAINPLNVALDGIPAAVFIQPGAPGGNMVFAGSSIDSSYGVSVLDADHNTILNGVTVTNGSQTTSDGFSPPVVLTVTEPSGGGHTRLSLGTGATANAITLSNSSDAQSVKLAYDGLAAAPYHAVITATLQGSTAPIGTASFIPVFVSGTGDGFSLVNGVPTLSLQYAFDPVTLTFSEDSPGAIFQAYLPTSEDENGPCAIGSLEATPDMVANGGSFMIESGRFADTSCSFNVQDVNTFDAIAAPGNAVAQTLYVAIPGSNEIDAIGVPIGAGHADSTITGTKLSGPTGVAHGPFNSLYATTTNATAGADLFSLAGKSTITGSETAQFAGGSFSALAIDNLSKGPILSNAVASQPQYEIAAQKFAAAVNPDTAVLYSGTAGAVTTSITEDSFTYIYEALAGSKSIVLYPYQAESRGLNAPPQQTFAIPAAAKGIVCDLAGHLYVADGSSTITEYASPLGSNSLSSIGTFVDATVSFTGVAVDGAGNVFGVGIKSGAGFAEEFVAGSAQRYSKVLPGVPGQVTM